MSDADLGLQKGAQPLAKLGGVSCSDLYVKKIVNERAPPKFRAQPAKPAIDSLN